MGQGSSCVKPSCVNPTTKHAGDEMPKDAAWRLYREAVLNRDQAGDTVKAVAKPEQEKDASKRRKRKSSKRRRRRRTKQGYEKLQGPQKQRKKITPRLRTKKRPKRSKSKSQK